MYVNPQSHPKTGIDSTSARADAKPAGTPPGVIIRESSAQTFSVNEIRQRGSASGPGRTTASQSATARAVYSPEFEKAYTAAQQAIDSPECKFYEDQVGWLSPSAEYAVGKLAAIVSAKQENTRQSEAAKQAFSMKPLTPDESQAWEAMARSLPPVYKAYLPACSPWRPVDANEVRNAIIHDSALKTMLEQQPAEGKKFLHELTDAINRRSSEMSPTDTGMAITFQFPQCYGTTAHIAVAGMWRDEAGQLRMSVCHQESMPPKAKGQPFSGVVYDGFDTSRDYPGGLAPAVETLKLAGPPAASVFPCPHPEAIVKATQDIAGPQRARQYAPTYTWITKMGAKPEALPPETCFNVTHKVLAAMYFAETEDQPLLPTLLPKMASFGSIERNQFAQVKLGNAGKVIDLDTVPSLPFKEQVQVFLRVGKQWGTALPWDVALQTQSKEMNLSLKPGQTGIPLPPHARGIKLSAAPKELTLNGKPVRAGKTYTPAEANAMVFSGQADAVVPAVTSIPAGLTSGAGAKL